MKAFIQKIAFCLRYFAMWLAFFVVARLWFMLYYSHQTDDVDLLTLLSIPWNGLILDLSASAYLSLFPFVFMAFSIWLPSLIVRRLISIYTIGMLILLNFLLLLDLVLFHAWGTRLTSGFLMYLSTPGDMIASASTAMLFTGGLAWLVSSWLWIFIFSVYIKPPLYELKKGVFWQFPALLLITSWLFLIMRGGWQTIPINESRVYFSNNNFANQAAVNFAWSFGNSLNQRTFKKDNPYREMDPKQADQLFEEALQPCKYDPENTDTQKWLRTSRPNIILIFWESLTAKIVAPLGGEAHVTDNFNRLVKEGILFDHFYANGDRSDKGLVAVLSGYLPQPDKSIITMPEKTRHLPMLTQKMAKLGYHCSFYYGSDLDFANMNTYLHNGAIERFIDEDDFSKSDRNSKWGVHDHIMMERFLKDFQKQDQPFFAIWFTLSSHEPFEFPDEYKFGDDSEANQFRSAHAYTDKVIGNFVAKARKEPWWDNTLLIIMADHGHPLPVSTKIFNAPQKFHIPMLWLGGALAKRDTIVTNLGSQTDFAYTLLPLLGEDPSEFRWGMDILKPSPAHFVFYDFNKGFGILNAQGKLVYDYNAHKPLLQEDKDAAKLERLGKAITQSSYQDFLEK